MDTDKFASDFALPVFFFMFYGLNVHIYITGPACASFNPQMCASRDSASGA